MLRNCVRCGRLYHHERSPLCPDCSEQSDADYRRLREHLRKYPNASAVDISRSAEIDSRQVTAFIKNRRVRARRRSPWKPHCEVCGVEIPHGRTCDACRALENQEKSAPKPAPGYARQGGVYRYGEERRRRHSSTRGNG